MKPLFALPLRGAGGEPVSFARSVYSHGCAGLPPATISEEPLTYRRPLRIGGRVVDLVLSEDDGKIVARTPAKLRRGEQEKIVGIVERMFRLRDDLTPFYTRIGGDESLSWAAAGAGRILASPSVFEDVLKTICTTNCAWSATERMTRALVELGGGAFPDAAALAATPERWYRDSARMGYRGAYVKAISRDVASGSLDLEALLHDRIGDAEVEETLLALPGIGPYGAAHVMLLLGRHRHLVLDSWTRPTYRRLSGKRQAADSTIRRAFSRYGPYAGLAFWLYLTRNWLPE